MSNTKDSAPARICVIPGCGKPMRSKFLCNAHYQKRMAGKTLEELIDAELNKSDQDSLGSGVPFPTRISEAAKARLKSNCEAMGFPSAYKLGSSILENWQPPKK